MSLYEEMRESARQSRILAESRERAAESAHGWGSEQHRAAQEQAAAARQDVHRTNGHYTVDGGA